MVGYQGVGSFDNDNSDGDENCDYYHNYHYYYYYPARARSAQARRACALRALGLLLADTAPTVGGGKTFRRVSRIFLRKQL